MIVVSNEMTQEEANQLVDDITNQRFDVLIHESDLPSFHRFRTSSLEEHGRYLLAITTEDLGICWFVMDEEGTEMVFMPEIPEDSTKPVDVQDIPVWYLNPAPQVLN